MDRYYEEYRASIHRGVYPLAAQATEAYEGARARVAAFAGSTPGETVFTRNATEAINLVAYSWGRANVGPGDLVVVTQMEHHSNLVPWQMLELRAGLRRRRRRRPAGARRRSTRCSSARRSSSPSPTSPTCSARSTRSRRSPRAPTRPAPCVVVDGAQAAPHMPVDVARAGRRLLRVDRPQGLRADRHRRAARPPRAARGDAAVPRRRAHDLPRRRLRVHVGRAAREVRGRHVADRRGDRTRRRGRVPRGHRHGRGARARAATSSATRSSACASSPA